MIRLSRVIASAMLAVVTFAVPAVAQAAPATHHSPAVASWHAGPVHPKPLRPPAWDRGPMHPKPLQPPAWDCGPAHPKPLQPPVWDRGPVHPKPWAHR